jgi:hypothetical protein
MRKHIGVNSRFSVQQPVELSSTAPKSKEELYKKPDFIISILGLALAIVAIGQTYVISKQQQEIKGFGELLKNSKDQTDKLTKAVSILTREITILDQQLLISANNNRYAEIANRNRLFGTCKKVSTMLTRSKTLFLYRNDTAFLRKKLSALDTLLKLFDEELSNPFLNKNDSLSLYWFSSRENIIDFQDDMSRAIEDYGQGMYFPQTGERKIISLDEEMLSTQNNKVIYSAFAAAGKGLEYTQQKKSLLIHSARLETLSEIYEKRYPRKKNKK